jgi:hypothetical protein
MNQSEGKLNRVLVSLLCHPERAPKVSLPDNPSYVVEVNKTRGYAEAVREAIRHAIELDSDLVIADTDGYHPAKEIEHLATMSTDADMVKPYRNNIGSQSNVYTYLWSGTHMRSVKDVTGGMYRMSNRFLRTLPPLKSDDMTIHIEILNIASRKGATIRQYPYESAMNDKENSRRTRHYQLKLLGALRR